MAKEAKKVVAETAKADEYKYTVDDLADYLDIEPASARIKLRNAGVKKAPNGRYGWKTKTSMEEIGDELKSPAKKKGSAKKEEPKGKAKPAAAKKGSAKRAAAD